MPEKILPLPVSGRITSGFGYRKPPIGGASSLHRGIDIAANVGTPVMCPLDGIVLSVTNDTKSGLMLKLRHGINYETGYLHLSRVTVLVGQTVTTGMTLAYTGSTGNVTGPHLHYYLKVNGNYVDPLKYSIVDLALIAPGDQVLSHDESQAATNNKKDYFETIKITNKFINTLQQFIDHYKLKMTPDELLNFKNNAANIYAAYNTKQKQEKKKAVVDLVNVGTSITFPLNKLQSQNPYKVNQNLLVGQNYPAFIESEILKLLNNKGYKKVNVFNSETESLTGAVYKLNAQVSIWLWSKALSLDGSFLIDISQFVQNVTTNVDENGGNFSIRLPHLTYTIDKNGNFVIPVFNYQEYNTESYVSKNTSHQIDTTSPKFEVGFIDDNDELKANNKFYKRKPGFFNVVVQTNDVLFIRFEKLAMDTGGYERTGNMIKINPQELKDKVFDMIGLVDFTTVSFTGNNRQAVDITGRDLSKLVIEDSVYFFPIEYAVQNPEQIIKNSTKIKSRNRLFLPLESNKQGGYEKNAQTGPGNIMGDILFNFDVTQTIEDWLIFIFSQLANIDICPDALLSAYTDKTFIVSKQEGETPGTGNYKSIPANGIWQLVKLVTDGKITDRRIADASLSTDTGSLLNLIRKFCQKPFIEFTMDTYGNKYYFMVRMCPFIEQSYKTNKFINIFDHDVMQDSLKFSDEVYTWYRLTPMGSLIDASDGNMMIELPAVLLPEYVEIYGSKVLDVQSNYLDFDMSVSTETDINLQNIIKQAQDDLDWLIEAHAYLPFSRTGTITIKGDRRIKRGMGIRYFPTGEVFYVDAVNNAAAFGDTTSRTTTLQVSRGLVEQHFSKYFNIVNLRKKGRNEKTWTVNKDVFEFLLQRKQFIQ